MIRNYFKTALRTITKNKMYSFINILGLTIGLCACMIVATVVMDDLSYDKHWSNGDDLYRIISVNKMGDGLYDRFGSSFTGVGNALKNYFPEVQAVAELSISSDEQFRIAQQDEMGIKAVTLQADTSALQMLDFKVIDGSPKNYVDGISNIMITKSFAKKYFLNKNPVGEKIYSIPIYNDEPTEHLITALIEDLPSNSVLRSEMVVLKKPRNEEVNKKQWGTFSQNYILMKPGTDMKQFTAKVNQWYADFVEVKDPYQFEFQSLKDIYLHSEFAETLSVKGDYKNIFILLGIAIFLLLIACVNFINLTNARAIYRIKETGVRKILGAGKSQLVMQFLVESALFFGIAAVLSILIYQAAIPGVEKYLEHALSVTLFSSYALAGKAVVCILVLSFLIGLYPALLLSDFNPALAIKGNLFSRGTSGQNTIRKALVVFQSAISTIVLVALIIVQQQVSFLNNKDLGFNKNHLLYTQWINLNGKGEALKNELLRQPGVESVSLTSWTPGRRGTMTRDVELSGNPGKKIKIWYITGDTDMAKTMGLQLKKGRFLNAGYGFDAMNDDDIQRMDSTEYARTAILQSSLITAYTAKVLNLEAVNQPSQSIKNTPVGIVKDFTPESLKNEKSPIVILAEKEVNYGGMLVRAQPGKEKEVASATYDLLKKFYPEKSLDIKWVDEILAQQYKAESKLQKLFAFFSSLSMLLAALGIFGLIVQATAQRVKEIGIRKVLGASVISIIRLFSIDFVKLILLSLIIASPIAWWLMNKWLMDYSNRIQVTWWVFGIAGFVSLLIALITISFQAIKAATRNPVESLKTE